MPSRLSRLARCTSFPWAAEGWAGLLFIGSSGRSSLGEGANAEASNLASTPLLRLAYMHDQQRSAHITRQVRKGASLLESPRFGKGGCPRAAVSRWARPRKMSAREPLRTQDCAHAAHPQCAQGAKYRRQPGSPRYADAFSTFSPSRRPRFWVSRTCVQSRWKPLLERVAIVKQAGRSSKTAENGLHKTDATLIIQTLYAHRPHKQSTHQRPIRCG